MFCLIFVYSGFLYFCSHCEIRSLGGHVVEVCSLARIKSNITIIICRTLVEAVIKLINLPKILGHDARVITSQRDAITLAYDSV